MSYWDAVTIQVRDLFWGLLFSDVLFGAGSYYFLHQKHGWKFILGAVAIYDAILIILVLLVAWQAYSLAQEPIKQALAAIRKENKRAEAKALQDLMVRYKSGGSSNPPPP